MENVYSTPPKRLRDLNGFGPKSEEILAKVDIYSVEDFMSIPKIHEDAEFRVRLFLFRAQLACS